MRDSLLKSNAIEQFKGGIASVILPAEFQRHHDIFHRGQTRQQLKRLKDKPNGFVPQTGAAIFIQSAKMNPIQMHLARRRLVQSGAEADEGRLSTARRTDNGTSGPGRKGESYLFNNGDCIAAAGEAFAEPPDIQNRP